MKPLRVSTKIKSTKNRGEIDAAKRVNVQALKSALSVIFEDFSQGIVTHQVVNLPPIVAMRTGMVARVNSRWEKNA